MMRKGRTGIVGKLTIAWVVSLAAACSTTETEPASSDEASYVANVATEAGEEELICRRARPTGSRISERICLTAEEWDKVQQQSREMLDRATRKSQQYEDQ